MRNPEYTYNKFLKEYEIELGRNPYDRKRASIGVIHPESVQKEGALSKIFNLFNFFREPATHYEAKSEFAIFIYNLIWWLALINLSVALINMWPVAIFDGGRMFMLTIWAITGSEKAGQWAFKLMTYLILFALLMLMIGWVVAIF